MNENKYRWSLIYIVTFLIFTSLYLMIILPSVNATYSMTLINNFTIYGNLSNTQQADIYGNGSDLTILSRNAVINTTNFTGFYKGANFSVNGVSNSISGIWNNGTDYFITDNTNAVILIYNSTGKFKTSIGSLTNYVKDIYSNGSDFWIVDILNYQKVIHLDSSGNMLNNFTINTTTSSLYGITGNGSNFWITDKTLNKLFMTNLTGDVLYTINTSNYGIYYPLGLHSNGSDFWVIARTSNSLIENASVYRFSISNSLIQEINQSFTDTAITSSNYTFSINFTYDTSYSINQATLFYNQTNYNGSVIYSSDNNKVFEVTLTTPIVNNPTNISFYWKLYLNNSGTITLFNSTSYNQSVINVGLSTSCVGKFPFLNISNYEEENLSSMSGTVEYTILINNNDLLVTSLNGTATGTNISLCSTQNLSNSATTYNLQLRYYANNYAYKTYNIQSGSMSSLPVLIPLYYLSNLTGVQFTINYVDFNYLIHPNAVIQIQRQYLSNNQYNVVEIPLIDNDGLTKGTFNTNNIRYKLVVVENGVIIDTFNNIFPTCQNVILGTCQINVRGSSTATSSTSDDFSYTFTNINQVLTLTYTIPSGTAKTVNLITSQRSVFLSNITTCSNTLFSSGGTLICTYNSTVGDSLLNVEVDVNGEPSIFGTIPISENIDTIFLGNNYFIAFILLLTLVLMFIASSSIMLLVAVIGLMYLGLIFLIKGVGIGVIATSLGWLIIAVIIAIYKINSHEEKYI